MSDDDDVQFSDDEAPQTNLKKRKTKASKSEDDPPKKKKKTAKKTAKKKRNKTYDSSDEDDYRAVSSSEEELISVDGDLDDQDGANGRNMLDDISSDETEDEYDEELYKDVEDRDRLAMMTELDRQAILFDRQEKRDQIRDRNTMKAHLRVARGLPASTKNQKMTDGNQKTPGTRGRKPKASSAVPSSTSSVPRTKKQSLNIIQEKRLQEKQRKAEEMDADYGGEGDDDWNHGGSDLNSFKRSSNKSKQQSPHHQKQSSPSAPKLVDRHRAKSDDEMDEDEEVQYDASGRRISNVGDVTFEDLLTAMAKRKEIVQWIDASHWEKTIHGVFVKAMVGPDREGRPSYRLAEVIGYDNEGKPYSVPEIGDKKLTMWLTLAVGSTSQSFSLQQISNQPLELQDFQDWFNMIKYQQVSLPSKKFIRNVSKRLYAARNYIQTEEDIDREIEKNLAARNSKSSSHSKPIDANSTKLAKINQRNRIVNSAVEATISLRDSIESPISSKLQSSNATIDDSASKPNTSVALSFDIDNDTTLISSNSSNVGKETNSNLSIPSNNASIGPVGSAKVFSFADYLSQRT